MSKTSEVYLVHISKENQNYDIGQKLGKYDKMTAQSTLFNLWEQKPRNKVMTKKKVHDK